MGLPAIASVLLMSCNSLIGVMQQQLVCRRVAVTLSVRTDIILTWMMVSRTPGVTLLRLRLRSGKPSDCSFCSELCVTVLLLALRQPGLSRWFHFKFWWRCTWFQFSLVLVTKLASIAHNCRRKMNRESARRTRNRRQQQMASLKAEVQQSAAFSLVQLYASTKISQRLIVLKSRVCLIEPLPHLEAVNLHHNVPMPWCVGHLMQAKCCDLCMDKMLQ